jgi:hypothetical protein
MRMTYLIVAQMPTNEASTARIPDHIAISCIVDSFYTKGV